MLVKFSLLLLGCIFICTSSGENVDDLIVELVEPKGKIRGHVLASATGRKYYAFQEIPYGEPPVGENRFRPPKSHNGWDGILDCTNNRKICYQFEFPMTPIGIDHQKSMENTKDTEVEESEDCLYLNVYTPAKPGSTDTLSVYLFIHGGAFATGDGTFASLGPKYLIDGDIVIVTMNYRLGPFGFLSTGTDEISGNMGLKDQHLALEWTYKNIHLFGGNPQDIVLGGESAGAYAAGYHLLSPKSKGLVSGFIQQSGSNIGVAAFLSHPRQYAFELGRALGSMDSESTDQLVIALKNASAEQIVKASVSVHHPEPLGFIASIIWEPVIEDEYAYQAMVTSPMHQEMMLGNFNQVPCLLGFNSEESLGFMSPDESVLKRVAAFYDKNPSMLIESVLNVENKTLAGEKLRRVYTASTFEEDLGAFIKFTSDVSFIRATIRQAELTSKHVPVYLYQLSAANNINHKYPGVSHFLDMRYLWDMPPFAPDTSPIDEVVREIVLRLWWNFIKYKNPTPERDPVLQNIEWPTVGIENIRYLNLNKSMSIETNPRNYNNLRDVLLEYMRPPFYVF
ncbi:unnamed protein product [Phaedon cochleariae]|uniref:Carboxylic ester hydrolase n=1 Tax=Phaedon cochleariae TaxID=80249 RepID=A0A9P0DMF5_PHACE|nr:unnamed protein product [Phaedon cochleariae]